MSGRFESRLVEHLEQFLVDRPPQGGQIYLAEFHDASITDRFAAALVDDLGEPGPTLEVEGRSIELPAYRPADGVPTYLMRVVPRIPDDVEPMDHVVVQGFATKMRNLISQSADEDQPLAMLMVLDSDSTLDTLDASEELLADDGPVNLASFRQSLLEPEHCESPQGRALLRGLGEVIGDDAMYAEDTRALETLCAIRDAIERSEFHELPELIGKLPQFIREDFFTDSKFSAEKDEDNLTKAIEEVLEDNLEHAGNLQRAHRAGTDTRSRLLSNYEETFANEVMDLPDWSHAVHSKARRYEAEETIRRFRGLEIEAKRERIYKPLEDTSKTRSAVLLVSNDGAIGVTAEFSGDLEDTPFGCVDSNGETIGSVSKRENRVKATIEEIEPDRPLFARFQFYVGKKTTQGKSTHQFDIAVVPEWFYHATEGVSLDIDVEGSTFLLPGDQPVELTPPERIDFDFEPRTEEITKDGQTVAFRGPLTIKPSPPEVLERVSCQIAPPEEIPITLTFILEATSAETEAVQLPLMLSAIVDPETWAKEKFRLPEVLTIDTSRGEIYGTAEQGVRLEDEALELLQVEENIVAERTPTGRVVDGDSLEFGSVPEDAAPVPQPLLDAYQDLFDCLNERGRTPSTDPWDEETQRRVRGVLEAYEEAIASVGSAKIFTPYAPIRNVGTIRSTATDKVWLTPFHPVLLAYGLRIAEWRDEELVGHADGGFRREDSAAKFNATGLLPYWTVQSEERLLRGMRYRENPLWQIYSPVSAPGAVTPEYIDRVLRDKLSTFVQAFPLLFSLHPDRQLVLNLVNMGDLGAVVKGLFDFYRKLQKTALEPPTVLLRIYGEAGEGEALERFFTATADSPLRLQLEKKDDELVDLLRTKVRYVHAKEYVEENQKPAHLTLFRGLLREQPGIMTSLGELPSGTLKGGLFPRESIDVDPRGGETVYTVGFSCDPEEDEQTHRVAKVANSLEAGVRQNSYEYGSAPKKNIVSTEGADLRKLWDDSIWAVHVQPNVGIEFYLRPESGIQTGDGRLMIHYSDQYDASSPDYDVITSTNKREPYLQSLQQAIADADLANELDPDMVLSTLVSVDGELALKLQHASDTEIIEYMGFVGGLGLSKALLDRSSEDYVWVPVSLNELTRHDRAYRGSGSGLIPWESTGKASDDLCFVGVPDDLTERSLMLWVVETKGGTSKIATGRKQVEGALENLEQWFANQSTWADDVILRSEFGKVILDIARRMRNYGVMTEDEFDRISAQSRGLLEGEYELSFLRDAQGHVGEVVRIRPDTMVSSIDSDGHIRAIEAPISAISLLSDQTLEETLRDLDLTALAFDVEGLVQEAPDPGTDGAVEIEGDKTREAAADSEMEADTKRQEEPVVAEEEASPAPTSPRPNGEGRPSAEGTESGSDEEARTASPTSDKPEGDSTVEVESSEDEEVAEESPAAANQCEEATDGTRPTPSPQPDANRPEIIDHLAESPEPDADINPGELATDLKRAFDSLDIEVHPPNPSSVSVGPRKVGIDVLPKEGQKVEAILGNLDTLSVQIQSQGDIVGTRVPAKGAVHLEIPHGDPRDVYLREGLEALDDELGDSLMVPLGVDTENQHHSLSLRDERHALIGGATGSGKSNFLATVIASLAITTSPEEVTLSILDPKGVDFGRFADLPHVKAGGYYDSPNTSTSHLMDIVNNEVPRRQERLREAGVPSIADLNESADELGVEPLPYHVVVIDEYADLIMSLDDEEGFEEAVTRLAQIGRALGIIVLLATQRPSADIVSGKIKTNFPCRISFRLPSNTDSRVILDEPGAEDLEGSGDMIVISQSGDRFHLQGYYLTPIDARTVIEELTSS